MSKFIDDMMKELTEGRYTPNSAQRTAGGRPKPKARAGSLGSLWAKHSNKPVRKEEDDTVDELSGYDSPPESPKKKATVAPKASDGKPDTKSKPKTEAHKAKDYNKDGAIDDHEQDHADEYDTFQGFKKELQTIKKKLKKEDAEINWFALVEKTLTPAEKKKKEQIVKSMKGKGMDNDSMYAIATAQAKKVAENKHVPFDGPYTSSKKPRKDRYGNSVKTKNLAKHLAKKGMKKFGEDEQLDELSPATHASYQKKAYTDAARGMAKKRMGTMSTKAAYDNERKRYKGIDTSKYLNRKQHGVKPESFEIDERSAQSKMNKTKKNNITTMKGQRFGLDNPNARQIAKQPGHKTGSDTNKALGRAIIKDRPPTGSYKNLGKKK